MSNARAKALSGQRLAFTKSYPVDNFWPWCHRARSATDPRGPACNPLVQGLSHPLLQARACRVGYPDLTLGN
jgi:hypothetical protein